MGTVTKCIGDFLCNMETPVHRRIKQMVAHPEPVDGEVQDIDTGYTDTIVVTVEKDGEIYYEQYELTDVLEVKPDG